MRQINVFFGSCLASLHSPTLSFPYCFGTHYFAISGSCPLGSYLLPAVIENTHRRETNTKKSITALKPQSGLSRDSIQWGARLVSVTWHKEGQDSHEWGFQTHLIEDESNFNFFNFFFQLLCHAHDDPPEGRQILHLAVQHHHTEVDVRTDGQSSSSEKISHWCTWFCYEKNASA